MLIVITVIVNNVFEYLPKQYKLQFLMFTDLLMSVQIFAKIQQIALFPLQSIEFL